MQATSCLGATTNTTAITVKAKRQNYKIVFTIKLGRVKEESRDCDHLYANQVVDEEVRMLLLLPLPSLVPQVEDEGGEREEEGVGDGEGCEE